MYTLCFAFLFSQSLDLYEFSIMQQPSFFKYVLRTDVILIGKHKDDVKQFNGVVLSSHKSHIDFFLGFAFGDAASLGRMLVAAACPFMWLCGWLSSTFIVFNRSKSKRSKPLRERFTDAISKRGRLLIYPEGHRLPIRGTLSPFRTGILSYCFHNRVPVFLAPAEGAQVVLNYATGAIRRGYPIVINCCNVLYPDQYQDLEDFIADAQEQFIAGYEDATAEFDSIVSKNSQRRI
ncbi:hypothetical protein GEMRC1_001636 [Eukaryota sp. GEM-RC1]